MSKLDVLIVGGYGLNDDFDGSESTRDRMRLTYKGKVVSLGFLKHFIDAEGDLATAEREFSSDPLQKQLPRQLNTVMLYDFLTRKGFRTEAINYFVYEKQRFEELMALKPKVLALSTTFICNPAHSIEIARRAKELSPDTIVIAGGIKVLKSARQLQLSKQGYFDQLDQEKLAADSFFYSPEADAGIDAFVVDETGLATLEKLMKRIVSSENWRTIPNLVFWNDSELVHTVRMPEGFSFEDHTIDWTRVPEYLVGSEIPVRAGVGCPFKCKFCDFAGLLSKTKLRPIENILAELKQIQSLYPGRPIFFTDDNLFVSKKRTRQLCEGIIREELKFRWRAFVRVDAVDCEIGEIAARAGCRMALLGVESGDSSVLRNMDKRITPHQVQDAIRILDSAGISTLSTVIIGFPGETTRSVNATISLLNSYPKSDRAMHTFLPNAFMVAPLCPAASPPKRREFQLSGLWYNWSHATMDAATARSECERLVKSVRWPLLQYPEQCANGLEPAFAAKLMKIRQNLVKSGVNVLSESNARQVYQAFARILKPQTSSQPTHQPTASSAS